MESLLFAWRRGKGGAATAGTRAWMGYMAEEDSVVEW